MTPRLDRKTPVRPYLPSKLPGKTFSSLIRFPPAILKPLPGKTITPPSKKYIDFPIDLSGEKEAAIAIREPSDAREERRDATT